MSFDGEKKNNLILLKWSIEKIKGSSNNTEKQFGNYFLEKKKNKRNSKGMNARAPPETISYMAAESSDDATFICLSPLKK